MANKKEIKQRKLLVVFSVLLLVIIVFFAGTDSFQLFSVAKLSLDATASKGKVSDRGAEASTGIFKGEAKLLEKVMKDKKKFKEPKAPKIPKCKSPKNPRCQVTPIPDPIEPPRPTLPPIPSPDVVQIPQIIKVINLKDGEIRDAPVINQGVTGGGGVASSTIGQEGGLLTFIKDEVIVHDRFHTPANGQTTTGTLLIEWGHEQPITVRQFLVPNEFYDWFEVELPQTIAGEGISFDRISDGEFKYKLTIPEDLIDKSTVIPVRLIIDSKQFTVDGLADIEIERPTVESKSFSIAEWIRGILAEWRT